MAELPGAKETRNSEGPSSGTSSQARPGQATTDGVLGPEGAMFERQVKVAPAAEGSFQPTAAHPQNLLNLNTQRLKPFKPSDPSQGINTGQRRSRGAD